MVKNEMSGNKKFSDFLSILLKWKKFLVINLFVISVITVIITLVMDNQYKSGSTLIITSGSSDLGLSNMLSDVTSLLGVGKPSAGSEEYLLGILGSRELKVDLINKFHLADYYKITEYKVDKTIKRLETEYFYEINENGMIDISFIHKDPQISKEIVEYIIAYADSVNRMLHKEKARHYREFIEKRYKKANIDLKNAEIELQKFQEKTGLYVVPDQIMVNINVLVDMEKNLYFKKLELEVLQADDAPNIPRIEQLKREIKIYSDNLDKIKKGTSAEDKSIAFLPTDQLPEMYAEYVKVYREFEIQNRILETLTPIYEQALMDEQKNTPSIIVLDPPFLPEMKDSPKRSVIVIIVFLLSLFFFIPLTLIGESVIQLKKRNIFEEKLLRFFNRVFKIYRMKM